MDTLKRVLVTGADGFIGRRCLAKIPKQADIFAVTHGHSHVSDSKVAWWNIDLLKEGRQAVRDIKPTHLLHLAWYSDPTSYKSAVENLAWVEASYELFEEFYAQGGQTIVSAGTCFEYFSHTLYAQCKAKLYEMGKSLALANRRNFIWPRLFYVYGEGEAESRLVPHLVNAVQFDKFFRFNTSGHQLRDYIYVDDVATVLWWSLEWHPLSCTSETSFDLGSGHAISLRRLVSTLAEIVGKDSVSIEFGTSLPEQEPPIVVANIYKPQWWNSSSSVYITHSLYDGLVKTINAVQGEKING